MSSDGAFATPHATGGADLTTQEGSNQATFGALTPGVLRRLEQAIGSDRVVTDPAYLEELAVDKYWPALYGRAAGTPLGWPGVVVVPASEQDVSAVVQLANDELVPVVPRGGGSGTQGGAVPVAGGIVLDLTALDEIVDINDQALTATVQTGINGQTFERYLNERGLMFPHYPASVALATVGGYIAARGSGVLSTRYGKIEDLVLSLRVVTPTGEIIETLPVPRHAAGPELTQLFIGSEGVFGVITQATVQLQRLPNARSYAAVAFPSLSAGVASFRDTLQSGYLPAVIRLYDPEATQRSLGPVLDKSIDGVCALLVFTGSEAQVELERNETLRIAGSNGGSELDDALAETWWEHRYDFYAPPHYPELPSIFGTLEFVTTYDRVLDVHEALQSVAARYASRGLSLTCHLSHWYHWGVMVYGRFLVPDGGDDAAELHDQIWHDGIRAGLQAGAVMNDHHGVGLKLAPFMRDQYGEALNSLQRIKRCLDPNNIMNPRKLGL